MTKISDLEKELSKWRGSKNKHTGKKTPEHIRKQAIGLLTDYSPYEIQKRLGINVNTLKNWQAKDSSEAIFIRLPSESEKREIITPLKGPLIPEIPKIAPSNLSLKISNGNWSVEGALSLKDWHSAIRLLEGAR